jgi:thiamine transport system substrate-binding protein
MTGIPQPSSVPHRLRGPGRSRRVLVTVLCVVVVVVAGLGLYTLASQQTATLVIYTYPSLFGGTNCGAENWSTVFGAFEQAHDVHIDVECPSGTLASTLLAQQNAPGADLVIGLDELTAPQADADHLLVPYAPPELANVAPTLVSELSPDDAVVPYEWGYLGIDYNSSFVAQTQGAVSHLSFPELAANASWARQLLVEDPSVDITGEEFLVWEIEYYEHVLHQDWQGFWSTVLPEMTTWPPSPDWGTAFGEFTSPTDNPQMVVSYTTDPAYAAANGQSGQYNSTVSWSNGTGYGWRTIYGIGIVAGTHHLPLDEAFENWFLGGTVQNLIPLNEWEYPANDTIALPSVYDAALDPSSITPLNADTTPSEVAANLTGWVNEWLTIATGSG